jgi:uncharacterized membrane protein YoaK (UPF0700 family)
MAERTAAPRHLHLVGVLAFASGGVDIVTLMALGGAFTSVITGNLIFTGRAIGTESLAPALQAAMAIAGYVAGVAAGSKLAQVTGRRDSASAWPRRATTVLTAECGVLLAVNAAWIGYGAAPPAPAAHVMLIAAALALGMQGAATRAIAGAPSTTYMTGALTSLVESLAIGRRMNGDASAAIGLLALVAGAACGAVLVEHGRQFALLPPLIAVILVVTVKTCHHRAERNDEAVLSHAAS